MAKAVLDSRAAFNQIRDDFQNIRDLRGRQGLWFEPDILCVNGNSRPSTEHTRIPSRLGPSPLPRGIRTAIIIAFCDLPELRGEMFALDPRFERSANLL